MGDIDISILLMISAQPTVPRFKTTVSVDISAGPENNTYWPIHAGKSLYQFLKALFSNPLPKKKL